jgi:membrane protein insertase Oxa1/YidC/SpoIIIJ
MKNKVQFSKILTILSFMMFVWTLYCGFSASFNQLYDISVYVTAITVSGGIFGVCLKSYMSKSKAENIYKVQKTMYEDIMDIKLYYNEEMMKLIQKYNLNQEDINMADNTSYIDNGVDNIVGDMQESINNHLYDTKTEDDIENY